MTLGELLDRAANRWPEKRFVTVAGMTLTFREARQESLQAAGWLADQGVQRGDRVLISMKPCTMLPVLIFACSRVGAAFVLQDANAPPAVRQRVVDDCEPRLVVREPPQVANSAAYVGERPLSVDAACLIYTSGSTAAPKAVVGTQSQVVFAAKAIQSRLAYTSSDIIFLALPLTFDYGLYQLFLAALSGAEVLVSEGAAGPQLLTDLSASHATVLPVVPSMAANLSRLLSRRAAGSLCPLPNLRLITNTGASMPPDLLARLRSVLSNVHVQLMYGLTECKRATIMPVDEDLRRPGSCGLALPDTEIYIIDSGGNRLPPDEVGEIVVRGPNVMSGYWRRPDLNVKIFPRIDGVLPALRTGDTGHLDRDGYLYFDGRHDDVYQQNGHRVSTIEVEAAACRVRGVEAAVVLVPRPTDPTAVLLVESIRDPSEVLLELRDYLEMAKIPTRCRAVKELPTNSNSKYRRDLL